MTFKDILKGLVQETGAVGATLMGMDGIPIEQHISEGAASDIEALGVEYGRLVSEAKKAAEVLDLGNVEEVFVKGNGVGVVLRLVAKEYYIAFLVKSNGNLGRERFLLKRASRLAEKELVA